MRAASDEFMTQEEGATLGAALSAAPPSSVDRRAWYVGSNIPSFDHFGIARPGMWDPGNRVSMIMVAFSRQDAIINAAVERAMLPSSEPKSAPPRLFEFSVRLDAALDISTADRLAAYGLTMPMIASFHDIEQGLRRMPFATAALRDRLAKLASQAQAFRGADKEGTRIEKVTALACAISFDGMLVPSPWHGGKDLLVFYEGWPGRVPIAHDTIEDVCDHGPVNLRAPDLS